MSETDGRHPKTVVVTGASAGIGRATARAFGRRGDRVALIARGRPGLEAAKREIEREGGEALVLSADVADADAVEEAAAETERHFGPIDVWVNNAMVTVLSPFSELTPDEYRRVTEVTYLGSVYGTMAALRRMRPRDSGSIVQVGSVLAYRGIPLQSAYCGAKHAIQGMLDSLWSELRHEGSGISLTMVNLPGMNTPQFTWARTKMPRQPQPVPPIYQPEVAADGIVWASESGRREITIGGKATAILWGNKFLPRLGDWYLAHTGFEGQQTDQPLPADRPDNLFTPVQEDRGARGPFGDRSKDRSVELQVNKRLPWVLGGVGALALAAALRAINGRETE